MRQQWRKRGKGFQAEVRQMQSHVTMGMLREAVLGGRMQPGEWEMMLDR